MYKPSNNMINKFKPRKYRNMDKLLSNNSVKLKKNQHKSPSKKEVKNQSYKQSYKQPFKPSMKSNKIFRNMDFLIEKSEKEELNRKNSTKKNYSIYSGIPTEKKDNNSLSNEDNITILSINEKVTKSKEKKIEDSWSSDVNNYENISIPTFKSNNKLLNPSDDKENQYIQDRFEIFLNRYISDELYEEICSEYDKNNFNDIDTFLDFFIIDIDNIPKQIRKLKKQLKKIKQLKKKKNKNKVEQAQIDKEQIIELCLKNITLFLLEEEEDEK